MCESPNRALRRLQRPTRAHSAAVWTLPEMQLGEICEAALDRHVGQNRPNMRHVYRQVTETHTPMLHPSTHCEYVPVLALHPLQELGRIFSEFKRVSQPWDQSFVQRRLVSGPKEGRVQGPAEIMPTFTLLSPLASMKGTVYGENPSLVCQWSS